MRVTVEELNHALSDPHCLTDDELLQHVHASGCTTPVERELADRLERALEELDAVTVKPIRLHDPRQLTLPL